MKKTAFKGAVFTHKYHHRILKTGFYKLMQENETLEKSVSQNMTIDSGRIYILNVVKNTAFKVFINSFILKS